MSTVTEPNNARDGGSVLGMILYGDSLTRVRLTRIYQHLHQELWEDYELVATWWRFDYFCDPRVAQGASEAFAISDLVVFAVHEGTNLPEGVRQWISRWPPKRNDGERSLLAFLEFTETASGMESPAEMYLRNVAKAMRMDYLPYRSHEYKGRPDLPSSPMAESRGGIHRETMEPWPGGLNE